MPSQVRFAFTLLLSALFSHPCFPLPQPIVPKPSSQGSICTEQSADFAEFRYQENIPYCRRSVSKALKEKLYRTYGIPESCRSNYTIDHFYPLSLGGDNQPQNLWPEHKTIKATRSNLEMALYTQISRGLILQAAALTQVRDAKLNPDTTAIEHVDSCQESETLQFLMMALPLIAAPNEFDDQAH